jgi:hypothetical protein
MDKYKLGLGNLAHLLEDADGWLRIEKVKRSRRKYAPPPLVAENSGKV